MNACIDWPHRAWQWLSKNRLERNMSAILLLLFVLSGPLAAVVGAHHAQVVAAVFALTVFIFIFRVGTRYAMQEPDRAKERHPLPEVEEALSRDDLIKAWEKTVDVQTHFNGMLQTIRVTGLSVALAIAGAGLAVIERTDSIRICQSDAWVHPSALVMACAMALVLGLMFFESYFYALLIGAVRHAEELETHIGFGLTTSISEDVKRSWAFAKMRSFWLSALFAVGLIFVMLVAFSAVLAEAPPVIHALQAIDPDSMSGSDALEALRQLKKLVN